jgi:putative membrane protein
MATVAEILVTFADSDWGHMDGGWWVVMAIGMVLFWALVIVGLIWLVRELGGRGGNGLKLRQDPLDLLDRRLADGTISPEDYRERRAILGGVEALDDDDAKPS